MKIEIKCRFTARVLFSHDVEGNNTRLTMEAAVRVGASLVGARLDGARLDGARLVGARLDGARLDGARLDGASLVGARLDGARLDGARLDGARLDGGEKLVGERPIFQMGPIGSRCAYFVAYVTDKGLRLRAGCFFGTREKFEQKLLEEHGGNVHHREYAAALAMVDAHAEIWTPAVEAAATETTSEAVDG